MLHDPSFSIIKFSHLVPPFLLVQIGFATVCYGGGGGPTEIFSPGLTQPPVKDFMGCPPNFFSH